MTLIQAWKTMVTRLPSSDPPDILRSNKATCPCQESVEATRVKSREGCHYSKKTNSLDEGRRSTVRVRSVFIQSVCVCAPPAHTERESELICQEPARWAQRSSKFSVRRGLRDAATPGRDLEGSCVPFTKKSSIVGIDSD